MTGDRGDRLRLAVPADLQQLPATCQSIRRFLHGACMDERRRHMTEIVVEEVLTNVIRHGCKDHVEHAIAIEVSASTDRVVVRVTDDCAAFDPLAAPPFDPTTPLEQRSGGGMGIHLFRSFARQVHYARSGDENRLEIVL